MALAFCLSGGESPGARETPDNEVFLVGVLLNTLALRNHVAADIQRASKSS